MSAREGFTDAEVMLRVKAGDESAFDFLVQKYRRPLVSFMYRMARNTAAAEDLAQEVFLRVYRSRQTYEASAKFTTWLYRIATNLAVNHARDTRHERPEVTVSLDEPDEETGTTLDVADGTVTLKNLWCDASGCWRFGLKWGLAGTAEAGGDHAQVSANGLQADCRCVEVERVGDQIVVVSGVRDFAGTVKRICMIESEPRALFEDDIGAGEVSIGERESKGNMVMKCEEIREVMPDSGLRLDGMTPEIVRASGGAAARAPERWKSSGRRWRCWMSGRAPEPSPYFDVRLQARLREEMAKPQAGWATWFRRPVLAAALTVLMGIGVGLFFTKGSGIYSPGNNVVADSQVQAEPGTAVSDLQALEKNHDLYSDFDLLDDLEVQHDVVANP